LRRLGFFIFSCLFLAPGPVSQAFASPENIVVLPFSNLTSNRSLDWVGESLSVALFETFSGELGFVVKPEERDETLRQMNVRKYAPLTSATVLEIAVNLDAELIVSGTFEQVTKGIGAAPSLRIRAHLFNASKLQRIKDFEVSGTLEDLSLIQTHLSWQILSALNPASSPPEQTYLASHPTVRLDALDRYVHGLVATSHEQKLRLFSAAVKLQPNYSDAYFQLGSLYYSRREFRPALDSLAKVTPDDAHFREAMFLRGLARYRGGEFREAADEFSRLAKNMPLGEVLNNLGASQLRAGDPGAAASLQAALETDPADPVYLFNAALDEFQRGMFGAAGIHLEELLKRAPVDDDATALLMRCRAREAVTQADAKTGALERLKEHYDETAFRQLRAIVNPGKHD
jgi:tetratricopeptide (TPR) repeat protein